MSGLAALFHRDGQPAEATAIERMLNAVPYRGPDGMFARLLGAVALGQAQMIVMPEEEAEQPPLVSPRTGCTLIADVRLDNRDDLLRRLAHGATPAPSDSELLLRAYEAWGAEAPAQILGDFAFVIWDPGAQRLVCARDTGGQRPLYYRANRDTFAAASEIQQLFQDPAIPVEPDDDHVRAFLVPLHMFRNEKNGPHTFYKGIRSLPPGHCMVVERDALRIQQYWELTPPKELRYRNEEAYAEHFQALLMEVLRTRLRSARPLGAMLSGGLDSSSLVCVAHEMYRSGQVSGPPLTSFSLTFEGLDCDERSLVEDIQRQYDCAVEYVPATSLVSWLELEPAGFIHPPKKYVSESDAIYQAAASAGVRLLLSGDVADSCVAGSPLVFDSLLRQRRLRTFWRYFRAYQRASGETWRKTVGLHCLGPLLPLERQKQLSGWYMQRDIERNRRRLLPGWMPESLRVDLFQRHLADSLAEERGRRYANPTRHLEDGFLRPPEVAYSPVGWPLEICRPFADRRLQSFLLSIPPEQKFEPHPQTDNYYAGSKRLLRRALRGILPETIRTRTMKTHFASLFEDEIARRWPDYAAAFGPGARSRIADRGYIEPARFWTRLELLREGTWGLDFMYVMRLMGLETWFRALELRRPDRVTVATPWPRPAFTLETQACAPPLGAHA